MTWSLAHVNERLYATFVSDIALRRTTSPVAPTARARPSVNASSGRWQLAHEYCPVADKRGSKNNRQPRATLACDIGLSAGTVGVGKPGGVCQVYWARHWPPATRPAAATIKRRPSVPRRARRINRKRCRLLCDRGTLSNPLGELFDVVR